MGIFFALFAWGALVPRLYARGWTAQSLIERGLPLSLGALVLAAALVARATAALWTLFCLASTQVSPAQPAVAQALPAAAAGRALSADNLADFAGVFVLKWAIGGTVHLLLRRDVTSLRPSRRRSRSSRRPASDRICGFCGSTTTAPYGWPTSRAPELSIIHRHDRNPDHCPRAAGLRAEVGRDPCLSGMRAHDGGARRVA
jgi:hypothetical protein